MKTLRSLERSSVNKGDRKVSQGLLNFGSLIDHLFAEGEYHEHSVMGQGTLVE